MSTNTHEVTTESIEYLRHGDVPQMARLFRPQGVGPFPAVIDLHGGAWTSGDLADGAARDEALAKAGIFVMAANFRHAEDGYPTSLVDINYAVRWLKARAGQFNIRADRIGLSGVSSGGHLAMLAAMRPRDPRYAAQPLANAPGAIDATVRCVAMSWPVINPQSRYHHAQRLQAGATPPDWSRGMKERHDRYWKTEAAMQEGNPMLILERGETVELPPSLWVQGRPDQTHDYHDPDGGFPGNEPERFISNYRKAGGDIEIVYVDNAVRAGPASYTPITAFFRKHLG